MKAATLGVLVVSGFVLGSASTGWSANCGGNGATGILCSCGDTVVADHNLTTDPVISTDPSVFCAGDGLVVADGVTLDLNGKTIRGGGTGTGISLSNSSVAKNGKVKSFELGVHVDINAIVESMTASLNVSGIVADSSSFLIRDNVVRNNVFRGIVVLGTASNGVVKANNVQGNGNFGIVVLGIANVIKRNSVRFNGGGILMGSGNSNTFVENNSSDNSGDGIQLANDSFDGFSRNRTNRNGDSGIQGNGKSDVFVGNGARSNGISGIDAYDVTNLDDGGNTGAANGGAVQCEIAGVPCK